LGFPMPTGLQRHYGKGHLHFMTFSCYRRLPLLGTSSARDLFVQELAKVRAECSFLLIGYVVMPNHVHLLLSESSQATPSTVLQMLKQRVSRKMRKQLKGHLTAPSCEEGGKLRSFWQPRFYDFTVYTHGKLREKLNYMHANPVTQKLVAHPRDWPWSSWSCHEMGEAGLITIDSLERLDRKPTDSMSPPPSPPSPSLQTP
jgi:putative transposase